MRNIEIKARISDIETTTQTAASITGPEPAQSLKQTDTYFNVPRGRLKLREFGDEKTAAQLIYYERPDESGPKRSYYEIAPTPEPDKMKHLLDAALGVKVIVVKHRDVYFYENVRIHLDRVDGLGSFLEFEAVMPDDTPDSEGKNILRRLMKTFSISDAHLIEESYCDLLEKQLHPTGEEG